jgi:hypothetical protein
MKTIELIHELLESFRDGRGEDMINAVLAEQTEFAGYHFSLEAEILGYSDFPIGMIT